MRSTFFGLSTALTGIMTNQRALDTTNHNVTNISTEGYTRQRVNQGTMPPFSNPAWNTEVSPGQLGAGVQVMDYARMRDQFIDLQYRQEYSKMGEFEQRADALGRLNQVIDEPGDTGITSQLDKYWKAWETLQTRPESASAREALRAEGVALAQIFQDTRKELVKTQDEATARIVGVTTDLNSWVDQINSLNQAIFKVQSLGQVPNDLKDQRDLLLDKIAKTGDMTATTAMNGKVSINFGGQVLLDGASDTANPVSVDAAGVVSVGAGTATLSSGALKGLIDVRDTTVGGPAGYLAQLDGVASTLITEINNRHAAGFGLDGGTGVNFFSGANASDMAVDAAILGATDKIAASSTAAGLPGNADNAVSMAQLKFAALTINGATTTINGSWSAWVSKLGTDTDQANRMGQVQLGVMKVAASRRDAVGGVNLDEEMADMVRFQKSYNAAARMVTTIDSMLETIVTRMGLVGR